MTTFIHGVYIIITIAAGVIAFGDTSIGVIASGIFSPLIAWFGGSGLRGSFNLGDNSQKITGLILGGIALLIGYLWISYTGYWIQVFGVEMSGVVWIIIGFLVGLIFSTKKHSLGEI